MLKKTNILIASLTACFFALIAAGCNGDGVGANCEGVANLCEGEMGNLRCSDDDSAIEICQHNDDGCPVWKVREVCSGGNVCDDSGDEPVCTCRDTCSSENATQCDGTVIQTCTMGSNGCLAWEDTLDCGDSGEVCDASGSAAECVAGCTDDCNYQNELQCDADNVWIRLCDMGTDGCLHWVNETDCSLLGQVCDASSGTPACIESCIDECTTEYETQCSGTMIQVCEMGLDGCLDWVDDTDCADTGEVCDDSVEPAVCGCVDECTTAGETQCSGTIIQSCQEGTDGCNDWVDVLDCSDYGLTCDDTEEPAICPTGGGDSCDDVEVITAVPFIKAGTDFTANYTDAMSFSDSSCTTGNGAEAVFAVDLASGQEVLIREFGDIDVVISIQSTCGEGEACLLSEDFGEVPGQRYSAEADGRYHIIIEGYSSSPTFVEYEIHVDLPEPEDCGDGIDNDMDGLTDCDDDNCFGDPTHCATEINCHDGEDNDADGSTDCDDSDCDASPWCAPFMGYWEDFGVGDNVDVGGHSIVFTPDPGDTNLYTWTESDGVTDFAVTPGTGATTATLTLGDDDNVEHTFSTIGGFTFYGTSYTSMFVGSNGFITFGSGDSYKSFNEVSFFDYPRIGIFDADLDPDDGSEGAITVDEFADTLVLTFDAVPAFGSTDGNSFQAVLHADSHTAPGVIECYYVDLAITNNGFVGISNGAGDGTYPSETDYVPPPPPPPFTINEVGYDGPGTDDAEFVEIHGEPAGDLTGHHLVHFNGSDGAVIWAIDLTGRLVPADGLFVIGAAAMANVDVTWTDLSMSETDTIQNGGDTIVLYTGWDGATGTAVDAVAYESADNLFGEGNPSTGTGHGNWNTSIGRYPDGTDTDDNETDFPAAWWSTPGEPNTPAEPAGHDRVVATVEGTDSYPVTIPDGDAVGIDVTIAVDAGWTWFPDTINNIHVGLKIAHLYIADLEVSLTSPAGTAVMLHDNSGGSADDIMTVYDLATSVDDTTFNMDSFNSESTAGTWTLHLADNDAIIEGQIMDWIIWVEGT